MIANPHPAAQKCPIHRLLTVGLILAGVWGASLARAGGIVDVVEQVSVDRYTDFLQNDLYAHDGEARCFGPEHDWARQSIQDRFESFGLATRLDPFLYDQVEYYNVVGVLPGLTRPREIYIVGAHFDSVAGCPGACDNATSAAIVMEAARVLSQYLFEATLVFIAFDREEQGLVGSKAYANEHAHEDVRAMIAMDVTGYRPYGPEQPEYNQASLYYQSGRPTFIDGLAEGMELYGGLACTIARNPGPLQSDYIPFDSVGLPAAVLTSRAGAINYLIHTSLDSLDNPGYVDYAYATQTAQGIVGYLATCAGLEPVRTLPDFNGDWKVDIEDLALLMEHWNEDDPAFDIAPPPSGDGMVDDQDVAGLLHFWDQEIVEPGLICHWRLDEANGTTAVDRVGGKNGSLSGGPAWQPQGGRTDGALAFDGVDDYVRIPAIRDPLDQAFSVFAWVQGGAPGQAILSRQKDSAWLMADTSEGFLLTELQSPRRSGCPLCSPVPITGGDWHRVGLTWDGTNRILYVDDIEVARDTQDNLPSSSDGLYIGSGYKLDAGSFWSGLIDDVRIYDRAVEP
ncbi:MAG: M28 family peptidase [Phycisphaerae bacterium]|nr:M28 family peptidase [Phycisphaerae bacterium]